MTDDEASVRYGNGSSGGSGSDSDDGSTGDSASDVEDNRVYTPTFASASTPTLRQAFATSRSIEGDSGVNETRDDNGIPGSDGRTYLAENDEFALRKTDSGFIMSYRGEDVTLATANAVDANYTNSETVNGETVNLGYVASENGSVNDLANDNVMVPVRFGILLDDQGSATARNNDSYVEGYSVVGVETAVSEMPTTGTATYRGAGVIEAAPRNSRTAHALFSGPTRFDADFGSGTVSGRMDITQRAQRNPDSNVLGRPTDAVQYGSAARPSGRVTVRETAINNNGFESELQFSDRARAIMGEAGVSSDTRADAKGRFYGRDAEGVGAVIRGEGSSHVVTGVMTGSR